MRVPWTVSLTALLLAAELPPPARAFTPTTLPTNFSDEPVVGGLDWPVCMAFLPDGRILVIEKNTARVRQVIGNAISSTDPVLVVPNVQGAGSEQGLLGIAVDPGWPARPYVYLQYTSTLDPHIRISRFTVSGDLSFTGNGALTADPASRYDVISDIVDNYVFHNGGGLRFGTDGMLYSALGEDLEACYAQLLTTLYGKILRLDVSGLPPGPGGPPPYSAITPPGNPFATHPDIRAHLIWAYGVRNPYSFDVDPSNGDLMIADVGEVKQEVYRDDAKVSEIVLSDFAYRTGDARK